ncbi:MAG: hypothetical protein KTR32_10455 [Granulosicoccus sp.]|nr:hypothetical protein [Granulosicoccus sp.]
MTQSMAPLVTVLKHSWPVLLACGIAFALLGQVLQLILLVLRFGELPNYLINYDWAASVVTIVQSTPSLKDMLPIIFEEWWIEIGFMNYDYGNGISEWSLNVIPSRLVIMCVLGAMLATLVLLRRNKACHAFDSPATLTGAGVGTLLIFATSVAMSWVVCCATPSWVVGLAMLGLSVSVSLALEDLGPTLFYSGFALLTVAILLTSRNQAVQLRRTGTKPDAVESKNAQSYHYSQPRA